MRQTDGQIDRLFVSYQVEYYRLMCCMQDKAKEPHNNLNLIIKAMLRVNVLRRREQYNFMYHLQYKSHHI